MGRRRVDSWRLSRSLEEVPTIYLPTYTVYLHHMRLASLLAPQVAPVFSNYCANIRSETVDGGLEMWRGRVSSTSK